MKRTIIATSTVVTLLFGSVFFATDVQDAYAESKGDQLKREMEQIQGDRSSLNGDKEVKEAEVERLKREQERLKKEIYRVDMAIADKKQEIRDKKTMIEEKEIEIENLRLDIEELTERLKKRDELLKNRMRSIQENGGVINYLEVLLGAKNFGDFVDRVGAVSTIVDQDKIIIQKHQNEMKQLEEMQTELSSNLVALQEQLVELEVLNEQLNKQRAEKNVVMAQLEQQEVVLHEDIDEIDREAELLAAQEAAVKKALKQWEADEKRRKEEEQRRKKLLALQSKKNVANPGIFMKPVSGPITSNYGQRWGTLHAGIDVGKYDRDADVAIVAAASGVVFRSSWHSSYGNVVFITHNIGGQVYTTVYAHMENREVEEGEVVQQGQRLGYMGSTGNSTGPHLHFEIHIGTWNSSRSNSVNPTKYVDF